MEWLKLLVLPQYHRVFFLRREVQFRIYRLQSSLVHAELLVPTGFQMDVTVVGELENLHVTVIRH